MKKRNIFLVIGIILLVLVSVTLYPLMTRKPVIAPAKLSPNTPVITEKNTTEDIPLVTVIATGLEVPWALAFLPDNSLLVTERPGQVRLITKDGNLLPEPLLTLSVVQKIQGEGGLHGIAPHPEFSTNKYVYLYYTYANNGNQSLNRVARYRLENNKFIDERIILNNIPGALFHDGGRIKFGPDKFLYITTGDAQEPSLAQDIGSTAGKILRVTDEGQAAPGNPLGTLMYSYGHRNPQGITWVDGQLWETEHGQSSTDELNRIEAGKNYGWPTIRGNESQSNLITPVLHSGSDTWAPGGMAYLNGSIYFAGLRGQALFQATPNDNTATLKTHFQKEFGRIREVIAGPDGMLYITTSNRDGRGFPSGDDDRILRINPSKL